VCARSRQALHSERRRDQAHACVHPSDLASSCMNASEGLARSRSSHHERKRDTDQRRERPRAQDRSERLLRRTRARGHECLLRGGRGGEGRRRIRLRLRVTRRRTDAPEELLLRLAAALDPLRRARVARRQLRRVARVRTQDAETYGFSVCPTRLNERRELCRNCVRWGRIGAANADNGSDISPLSTSVGVPGISDGQAMACSTSCPSPASAINGMMMGEVYSREGFPPEAGGRAQRASSCCGA
jgi:hypothetical protein